MADIGLKYGNAVAFTVTNLASLATSATRVAGWTSGSVQNGVDQYLDELVSGQFTVHTTVAPTANKTISVYAYAAHQGDGTPIWPDLFSVGTEGTEGTATVHDEEQRDCGLRLLWGCTIDAGTNEVYVMPPTSVAEAFGGILPRLWALWVVQDTGQALHSAGQALYHTPVEGVSV